jgi:hypothetical protein
MRGGSVILGAPVMFLYSIERGDYRPANGPGGVPFTVHGRIVWPMFDRDGILRYEYSVYVKVMEMDHLLMVRYVPTMCRCVAIAGTLGGCIDRPIPVTSEKPFEPGSAVLLPGGNYHLVTVRQRPSVDGQQNETVLCSEPSPDWAVAFGNALSTAVSGAGPGGASGSLSGSASTTESITAMAGRTAGVVALRDGLYTACQAYANGVIGKDAYSLILSQYGNLLVALAGGGGGAAASDASKAASPASGTPGVAVAVSTGGGSGSGSSAKPASSTGGSNDVQVALMQQQAVQAMLVACINENDQTLHTSAGDRNPLLDAHCQTIFTKLDNALDQLLKPPGSNQAPGGGSVAKKK